MKEIIGAIVIIASIIGGTAALKGFHDATRKAALEKAAQGLPPLTGFAHALSSKKPNVAHSSNRPVQPSRADSRIRTESPKPSKSR